MSACLPFYGYLPAGAGGLASWNGDTGPAVVATTTELPNASTVAGATTTDALDTLAAAIGGLIVISDVASLEAAFPAAGGVHTINKQTIWVSQTGAPYFLPPGGSVALANPGTIVGLGGAKVTVIGDVAGPLVSGELVLESLAILNTNPGGTDILAESLAGRLLNVSDCVLLGQNAGTVQNCLGVAIFNLALAPSGPGATGLTIDGTNAVMLWSSAVTPPGTVSYTAWTVAPTCTILVDLRFEACAMFGTPAIDTMLFVDLAATLPTGALPTNVSGFEVFGCALKGGAILFGAGGRDETDIRILAGGNTGAPTSQFIGVARADTTITASPVPISQTHIASNAWEVVPSDNGPAAPPDDVILTIETPITQRHSMQITSRIVWSMRYDGAEDNRIALVAWEASADRSGGSASVVDAQLEFDDGGGWTALPRTRDSIPLLSGSPQTMSGRTVLATSNAGFMLRLVSRTSNNATVTDWHVIEVSKGI